MRISASRPLWLAAAAAVMLPLIVLTGCRTDDVIRNTAAFKDDAKSFADLALQVENDRRESCLRILALERLDIAIIVTTPPGPPPSADDPSVQKQCKVAFDQAADFAKSIDLLSAYFTGIASAATGKPADFKVGALTTPLQNSNFITSGEAGAITGAAQHVSDYLIAHARVVAIQAAVRSSAGPLNQIDDRMQHIFASGTCDPTTYCGFMSVETVQADSVFGLYFGKPAAIPPSVAEKVALLSIRREWDAYYDDQRKRVDTGRRFAVALHKLVQSHNALLKLIDRVPDSSESVTDRL